MITVRIWGNPAPKGSLKCIGGRGRPHQLIEAIPPKQKPHRKQWRSQLAAAGQTIAKAHGGPHTGPVTIRATLTLSRPKTAALRLWPYRKPTADIDKLARMILDGLADGGAYLDDVQVVSIHITKHYETPGPDQGAAHAALPRPGAVITLAALEENE